MADPRREDVIIRAVVVVTLGVVLIVAIIGLTVTAVATDRNLARPETFTFGGVVLLAALGGVSWWTLRRNGGAEPLPPRTPQEARTDVAAPSQPHQSPQAPSEPHRPRSGDLDVSD